MEVTPAGILIALAFAPLWGPLIWTIFFRKGNDKGGLDW